MPQRRTGPFRLARVTSGSTRQELCDLALIRRQELDGFVEGLFNSQDRIDLPPKTDEALGVLGNIRAMMAGIHEVAKDNSKPADATQLEQTFKHARELSVIMEKEINIVVLDCTRARRQMMGEKGVSPTALH